MTTDQAGPLHGLRWLQIRSVPQADSRTDPVDWLASRLLGAVVAAHIELMAVPSPVGPALAACWLRSEPAGPVSFLVGGRPRFPPASEAGGDTEPVSVLFPPGTQASPLNPEDMASALSPVRHWVRCTGFTDLPGRSDVATAGRAAGVGRHGQTAPGTKAGFDDYVLHLPGPFAWLTLVEPVGRLDLEDEAAQVSARLTATRKRESSESERLELERGQQRLRELATARTGGLWRIHVLAGAADGPSALQAASLLAAAGEAGRAGYALTPGEQYRSLDEAMQGLAAGPDRATSPFLAGSELVAMLMHPPSTELPGVTVRAPMRFDLTPAAEDSLTPGREWIELGSVLDSTMRPAAPLRIPYRTLNRHGFVCGATGSGKSQTTRRLLEALSGADRPIPWLVVESAKAEYAAMAGRLGPSTPVTVLRPGDVSVPPASLNPLEPEAGYPLQSHADLVRALCTAAFDAVDPFPQVLAQALTLVYERAGWNLVTGELRAPTKPKWRLDEPDEPARRRYPTLLDLQLAAREVVARVGYGREVTDNVRGFIDIRMGSLRNGTPGRFFEGGHPLDFDALLAGNVVIELETITNDQDKAFLIGSLLIRLVEHLRMRPRADTVDRLRHVLVIEEAHRLLRNTTDGPSAAAVDLFASMLAEIRAYGEGVLVVEQIPSKLLPDVVKNTALKIVHRLPARDDRDLVGAAMNLSPDQSEAVVALRPGVAAISMDGDDRALLVGVTGGMGRENAATASVDVPLAGRRSLLCDPACSDRPCTLAEIETAAQLATHPANIVMTEATTVSVIRGDVPPRPRGHVLGLWPPPGRTRTCAVAQMADRAVAARRVTVRPWVDGDDLARRVNDVLLALLDATDLPAGEPERWRAGVHRWGWVRKTLRQAVSRIGDADLDCPPHHDTATWRDLGLQLDGKTLRAQLAEVEMNPAFAFGVMGVAAGDIDQSGLAAAVVQIGGVRTFGGLLRSLRHACDVTGDERFVHDLRMAIDPAPVSNPAAPGAPADAGTERIHDTR